MPNHNQNKNPTAKPHKLCHSLETEVNSRNRQQKIEGFEKMTSNLESEVAVIRFLSGVSISSCYEVLAIAPSLHVIPLKLAA